MSNSFEPFVKNIEWKKCITWTECDSKCDRTDSMAMSFRTSFQVGPVEQAHLADRKIIWEAQQKQKTVVDDDFEVLQAAEEEHISLGTLSFGRKSPLTERMVIKVVVSIVDIIYPFFLAQKPQSSHHHASRVSPGECTRVRRMKNMLWSETRFWCLMCLCDLRFWVFQIWARETRRTRP